MIELKKRWAGNFQLTVDGVVVGVIYDTGASIFQKKLDLLTQPHKTRDDCAEFAILLDEQAQKIAKLEKGIKN